MEKLEVSESFKFIPPDFEGDIEVEFECDSKYVEAKALRDWLDKVYPQWIKVEDRLPEVPKLSGNNKYDSEFIRVLVTYNFCGGSRTEEGRYVRKIVRNKEICRFEDSNWRTVDNVIAWMPLPEPYKAG